MAFRKKSIITISSLDDLLASFLTGAPSPDFRFETTRLQIFPISFFRSHLRVPMPPKE